MKKMLVAGAVIICGLCMTRAYAAGEKYGIVVLRDIKDSVRLDFTRLDTPRMEIDLRNDTFARPDIILIRMRQVSFSPLVFRVQAPYTQNLNGKMIDMQPFINNRPIPVSDSAVDSLRRRMLPVLQTINPQCRLQGQCDSSGAGFFLRTSESGVAFFRPVGKYIGGIDRIGLFWAYSSDGLFGKVSTVRRSFQTNRIAEPQSALYDLNGRLIKRSISAISTGTPRLRILVARDRQGRTGLIPRFE